MINITTDEIATDVDVSGVPENCGHIGDQNRDEDHKQRQRMKNKIRYFVFDFSRYIAIISRHQTSGDQTNGAIGQQIECRQRRQSVPNVPIYTLVNQINAASHSAIISIIPAKAISIN